MDMFWIVTLLFGFGLYYTARDSCHYALRLTSRIFGPLLIVAGLIGTIVTPSSWVVAVILLGIIAVAGLVTVALMLVARLRRRTTH